MASSVFACGRPNPTPTPEATLVPEPTLEATFPPLPPAWPYVFSGTATVGGEPVPAGYLITGKIDEYRSAPVQTEEGRYRGLPVGPLDPKFFDRNITFELTRPDGKAITAQQTLVFRALPRPSLYELDLVFPAFD
ncbi:MAG: hypothetical protein HY682_06110 [Chloroflexi bacterium]|nr:hypothetical protein [Chloroflexota bacterium]